MWKNVCRLLIAIVAVTTVARAESWVDGIDEAAAALAAQRQVPDTGVTLVLDGQPQATIVAAEEDTPAAELLNSWITLMSGVSLPISATPPEQGPSIYLGKTAADVGKGADKVASRSHEGIRIEADGSNVYIAYQDEWNPKRGNMAAYRAVGRFLEESFGCRWVATTEWAKLYPKSQTLRVRDIQLSEAPTMIFRRIWGAEGAFGDHRWAGWNGNGGVSMPMAHSWGFLHEVDFEKHPDWFRMDENGEREKGHWPNFGNEDLRAHFIKWAVESSEGGTRSISLSPPDSYRYDYSPEATKYDNPNVIVATTGWVSMTDRFMGIVNEAATEIYKQGQDSVVSFYAYSDYTMPPTRPELDKLSPNVCVWIAPIRYSRYHPLGHPNSPSRQELLHIVDGWSERASMIGYRTYNYNLAEILTPFNKAEIWAHDIPYLYKRGCVGINLESMNSWELSGPHLYQSIRMGYDPTLSSNEMMADYFAAVYGKAAGPMADYWRAVGQVWMNQRTEAGSIHVLPQIWTETFIAELDGYLTAAEAAAAGDEALAYRVSLARSGLTRAQYWRSWFDQINAGEIAAAKATMDEWEAVIEDVMKNKNGNKYERTYLRRFIGKITTNAYNAVYPEEGPARKVITVLPDEWKMATGEYVATWPEGENPWDVELDDIGWPTVKTYSETLSAQGYADYFGDYWYRTTVDVPEGEGPYSLHVVKADRKVAVYVNGEKIPLTNGKGEPVDFVEGFRGCTFELGDYLKPGQENQITLKVTHIPLPELFLGGLIAPVYLIGGE